jgi:hypothetical protein
VAPVLEQYASQNILSVDETVLFCNAEPIRTSVIKGETFHEGKKHKNHLAVLLSSSTLVTSRFEKPCCMENIKKWKTAHKKWWESPE